MSATHVDSSPKAPLMIQLRHARFPPLSYPKRIHPHPNHFSTRTPDSNRTQSYHNSVGVTTPTSV
ncbi:hypothetical protein BJ165DRAFT_1517827 [Panaeolus papilionaceus]|nr:hypothetical protein BJ165DRAFT_1517827 [Panaeolus papilionaceus]